MFTLRSFSIYLLLLSSFQLTWTSSPRNDEEVYAETSFGNHTGEAGNVQVKLDNNVDVHISNSSNGENGGDQIYQPLSRTTTATMETGTDSVRWTTSQTETTEKLPQLAIQRESISPKQKFFTLDSDASATVTSQHLLLTSSQQRRSIMNDNVTMTNINNITSIDTSLPVHANSSDSKSLDHSFKELRIRSLRGSPCSWTGHCDGARCRTENDCSDDRICIQGRCGSPKGQQEKPCSWKGHCDGAGCKTENDCSDDRICIQGRCGSADQQPDTNTNTDSIPSISMNKAGDGGSGSIIVNLHIVGGNGGNGGSTFAIPRQKN